MRTIRWTARIWSILVTAAVVSMFFGSHSHARPSEPIPPVDAFLLSLTGVSLLGLFVAWRWELVGGIFTIAMMFIRELAWVILKGHWLAAFLLLWVLILPPATLFLIAWRMGERSKKSGLKNEAG